MPGSTTWEGAGVSLGIQRQLSGEATIKIGRHAGARAVAELVIEHLPVQVINAGSFELCCTGPPGVLAGQYLDWGVFHVEHRFLDSGSAFSGE